MPRPVLLIEAIRRQAERDPHKAALIHNGLCWSYEELAQRIDFSRRHFAAQSLKPGRTVVLAIRHLAAAWVHGIALRSLGLNTICVPAEKGLRSLGLACIDGVVTIPGELTPELRAQTAEKHWELLLAAPLQADQTLALAASVHEGGHILMTSGTTGRYKMVLRDARDEAGSLPLHAEINGIGEASVVYAGEFPQLTAGGYRWPLITWSVGGTVVFHQGPRAHEAFQSRQLTHAFATPSTLAQLLVAAPDALPYCESLRLLVTGGALPRALAEMAQARLTQRLFTVLASTEALTLGITPYESRDGLQWHRIHPAREVQVVDDADHPKPVGELGLVRVRLLDGLGGYLDDAEASKAFFRDGWFYPGDLGMLAADGRLALHGRATEVINLLGNKIAAAPLEQAVQNHLGAAGVCLFTVPDEAGEETLHVVIEPGPPMSQAALEQALKTLLGRGIARVRYHLDVPLPRNHMGKLQRALLQERILSGRSGFTA